LISPVAPSLKQDCIVFRVSPASPALMTTTTTKMMMVYGPLQQPRLREKFPRGKEVDALGECFLSFLLFLVT
jgi:hypothetical protein